MEKEHKIKQCFHSCPFFKSNMDGMFCDHPYWLDKGSYENMIITHENSRDGEIPEKCPLRIEDLIIRFKLD